MMKEKMTYEEMLQLLRETEHEAPNTWDALEEELNLSEEIADLKTYEAPQGVWEQIENGLDETMPVKPTDTKILIRVLLLSAALLSLIYIMDRSAKEITINNEFVYSSEIEVSEILPTIESNTETFEEGVDFINDNQTLFTKDSFDDYQKQLIEMNTAIEQIKMMQEQYGEDDSSIKMLSRLERKKAELIKSMINRA